MKNTPLLHRFRGVLLAALLVVPSGLMGADLHLAAVGSIDPTEIPATRSSVKPDQPSTIKLVQFEDRVTASDRAILEEGGYEILSYLPDHAFVIRRPEEATRRAADLSPRVRWSGGFESEWKVSPELTSAETQLQEVEIVLWRGESADRALVALESAGALDLLQRTTPTESAARFVARVDGPALARITELEVVSWVEPLARFERRLDTVSWMVQSGVSEQHDLWEAGLDGSTEILALIDANIPIEHCFFSDPENDVGPDHRKILALFDGFEAGDTDNHGAHVGGILAGYIADTDPTKELAGIAYGARFVHGYDFNLNMFSGGTMSLISMFNRARDAGAFIHSNSYGLNSSIYTVHTRDIDDFTYANEDALVIFAISNGSLVRAPENAKNCLAVSSSRKSPNENSIHLGGTGPTSDGRIKPEIAAPGQSVISASLTSDCETVPAGGTSMAAPAVSGSAALVRQYFLEGRYPTGVANPTHTLEPTGSLLRAVLLTATRRMQDETPYPGGRQGWGRLVARDAMPLGPDETRRLWVADVRHAEGFDDVDEMMEFTIEVESGIHPLRVTLVWADPPAAPNASNPTINDLDLQVISPGGTTYLGNDTLNGFSIPGGVSRDDKNTVEQVHILDPLAGTWTVRVRTSLLPIAPQGFALAATGHFDSTLATGIDGWIIY